MPNQINFWPHLSEPTRTELIQHAAKMKTTTIYVRREIFYEQRNSDILERYNQLRTGTNMPKKEIYKKIAHEMSQRFRVPITNKAVELVVYRHANPSNF